MGARVKRVSPDYSLLDAKRPDGFHRGKDLRGLLEMGLMAMFSMIIFRSERQRWRRRVAESRPLANALFRLQLVSIVHQ